MMYPSRHTHTAGAVVKSFVGIGGRRPVGEANIQTGRGSTSTP
jgi:hypothetical protein